MSIREGLRSKSGEKKKFKMAGQQKKTEPTSLSELATMITALTEKVNTIQMDIEDIKKSKLAIDTLQTEVSTVKQKIQTNTDNIDTNHQRIKMLSEIVINQDNRIATMSHEIEMLKKQARRSNIIISGILEDDGKLYSDKIAKVKDFFRDTMMIEETIKVRNVYRFGKGFPRNLMVQLANPAVKAIIFSHASNLKVKKNAKRKLYFVNDDIDDEEKEKKRYLQHLRRENADENDDRKLHLKIVRGNILANNEIIKPKLSVPTVADLLAMDQEEMDEINNTTRVYTASKHSEKGSDFVCHFQRARNIDGVQKALIKMKLEYGDASHIVTAYRFGNAFGPFNQGYCDNGEFGAGWRALAALKETCSENIAVFIIRYHSGPKMGYRRFEIYKDLAKKAAGYLKGKLEKLQRDNRSRRSGSQLSLLSITSMVSAASSIDEEIQLQEKHSDNAGSGEHVATAAS